MNHSNSTQQQHVQIREALSAALASKPLVAQEAFLKFPNATDEIIEEGQKQSMLRRFRSLSMNTKEHTAWSEDTVKRKYPTEKTVELYEFSSEFETADLNQMLEPYQHTRCERGGYRIKWLNDTRALAVFRRAETGKLCTIQLCIFWAKFRIHLSILFLPVPPRRKPAASGNVRWLSTRERKDRHIQGADDKCANPPPNFA